MRDILVIKPSSLGDIIHGLLVAEGIRQQMPSVRISWVAGDRFAPLVRASETVTGEVFVFERSGGLPAFGRLIRNVRRKRFDAVLDFHGLARSGVLAFFANATRKIGRQDARELSGLACRERVSLPAHGTFSHAVEILLPFAEALGLKPHLPERLHFRAPAARPGSIEPGTLDVSIILFPDTRRPEKQWPHYPELTELLLRELPGLKVAWLGLSGPPVPKRAASSEYFIDLRGKVEIQELPGILAKPALVVGNDSGPLHVAAALQTPTLTLFGPTAARRYAPWPPEQDGNHVMEAPGGDLSRLLPWMIAERVADLLR